MGCHRSGTNLLYDMLLSSGGFAVYRGYLPVHKLLVPRFGRLDKPANRKAMMQTWLRSKGFRRSGLDAAELTEQVLSKCRSGGDFLRLVMQGIATRQNAARWALYDPDAVLHLPSIKADLPEALFVHIIRDGRDIALSLRKMGGFNPFPWGRSSRSLEETALYWEWMVSSGRKYGRQIQEDYYEIHYEDLVSRPQATLSALGQFLHHDLDYGRIQACGQGRLRETNSSFKDDPGPPPLNRWQQKLSAAEVASLERLIGPCLEELGYRLSAPEPERRRDLSARCKHALFLALLSAKLWLKTESPAGRFSDLSVLELSDALSGTDKA